MKTQLIENYKDLFDLAKSQSHKPGSKLGSMVRNGAGTVSTVAKAGVEMVANCAVVSVGTVAGFAQVRIPGDCDRDFRANVTGDSGAT